MELVTHRIPVKSRQSDEFLLLPIGDIQWSGCDKEVALKMLSRHIEWGVANNAYFIGMGDYIDFMSPTNRERLRGANLYDTSQKVIERSSRMLVDEIYEKALKPSRGRWLGLLEGHHFSDFADGTTSDMKLCDMLETHHLGTNAVVRLLFERGKTQDKPAGSGSYLIWAHHGNGGGQTTGASLNRIEKMIKGFEADLYLMGHDTKIAHAPIDRIEAIFPRTGAPRLLHRPKNIASTGGFMRGYVVGSRHGRVPRGGYVEQGMMNPTALGGIAVKITPRWVVHGRQQFWQPDTRISS